MRKASFVRSILLDAEIITGKLITHGARIVFLFPRGTIVPLLDALLNEGIYARLRTKRTERGFLAG